MEMNFFVVAVLLFFLFNIYDGYKKGMVKKIISFISLLFLCVTVVLIGNAIGSYNGGKILNVIATVVLLAVVGIVHHIIKIVVFPAKIIANLPVIQSVDKLLGVVAGAAETIILLWTVYVFVTIMNLGNLNNYILKGTEEVLILNWLYQHNCLVGWLHILGATITEQLHMG